MTYIDNKSAYIEAVKHKCELLETLNDLLDELDWLGLSTMPGDDYYGLRRSCEDARVLRNELQKEWD